MTEMMEAFEKSGGLFAVRQTTQDAPDEGGGIPFTINLVYSPSRGADNEQSGARTRLPFRPCAPRARRGFRSA